jgi:hypothetical protein
MKKIILFIMLTIGLLALSGSSSKKDKGEKEHIVLKGRIIFKVKNLNQIKFILEDKLGGCYRLTLFEEKITNDSDFLKEKGTMVEIIFKRRIYSKSDSSFNEKDSNSFQLNFLNLELKENNYAKIVIIALKTIHEIEKNMDCSIYLE